MDELIGMLPIERAIFEALIFEKKSLIEIVQSTKLTPHLVSKLLKKWEERGLITIASGDCYALKLDDNKLLEQYVMGEEGLSLETLDLVKAVFGLSIKKKGQFKLQKIYLNKEEAKVFSGLQRSVEQFLANIEDKRRRDLLSYKKQDLSEHTLTFWGVAKYGDVLQETLI
jgi:predicted methyltransferase